MFNLTGLSIKTMQILNPANVPGAEYFNYFFTIIAVFAMIAFGINILVRIISRS